MSFERLVRNQHRCMPALRAHALTAVSANVLVLASLLPAQAQWADAGTGETKTVPPFVMLESDTAPKTHDGGSNRGTARTTTGVQTSSPTTQTQQVNAGAGETKTVPPFVMVESDTALKAHNGGTIQGTASTITTTGTHAHGGLAETGGTISLTRGSVTTNGTSAMGLHAVGAGSRITSSADVTTLGSEAHAAFAWAGGAINLTGGHIKTSGSDAFGLLADRIGSQIESNASVVTIGANSIAAAATSGGTVKLTGGAISTSGVAAYGVYSSGDQSLVQSAINISTTGDYSHGALVQAGGSAVLTAGTVTTAGRDAAGLLSEGAGSRITSSANVVTSGSGAIGIFSRFAGFVEQTAGHVTSTGAAAHGLFATGIGSSISSTATVRTEGHSAAGAFADAGGSISVGGAVETAGISAPGLLSNGNGSHISSTANVTTTGQEAYGAQAVNGGTISLGGGTIRTSGDRSQGIRSIGAGSAVTSSAQISTSGSQAAGVAALSGGTVRLLGGSVATTGSGPGLYAFGLGSTITGSADVSTSADGTVAVLADGRGAVSLSGGTIQTTGSQSAGLAATYGSSAAIDNVDIVTSGSNSAGAYVTAATLDINNSRIISSGAGISSVGNASIEISNSSVRSAAFAFDAAFDLAGQAVTFDVSNSQLRGDAGLLRVTRGDNGRDGTVIMTLDGSEAIGTISDVEARTSGYTRVALTGGSRLTGGLNGVERLSLDRGTWTMDGPTVVSAIAIGPSGGTLDVIDRSISLDAPIAGSGELAKTGTGLLTLTGDSPLSGPTHVLAGTLVVNGGLRNSPVLVSSGAVLAGDGTIGSLTAQSGSTIAPGTTVGTLTVNGDVNFLPGSVYAVGLGASGRSDSIAASGQAILSGGAVQILPDQGPVYRANNPYTILRASTVSGTFEGTTGGEFAFLVPTLSYSDNAVFLTLTRRTDPARASFASVALTRNQISTANAVERLGAGQELFDTVLGSSVGGARQAFDALSGEVHGSAVTAAYRDAQLVQTAVLGRLHQSPNGIRPFLARGTYNAAYAADAVNASAWPSAMPVRSFDPRRFALWGEGLGSWANVDSNGNAAALATGTGGFILGADVNFNQTYRVGVAGGITRTILDVDARLSSGSNETVFGSLYGGATWEGVNVRLGGSYAAHAFETQRAVRFPGFSDFARASYDGWTAQAFAEIGYRFEFERADIEPFVGASVGRMHTNGFNEDGGAAALIGDARDHDLGTTIVGVRAEARPSDEVPLLVRGMLGWRHAFGEVEPETSLKFRGGAAAFTIWGVPLDRNTLVAEAGVYWQAGRGVSFGLTYEGQISARAQGHAVKGNLTSKF